ncbi:MAG: hypothetical protein ACJA13_003686 [Paraglaciecola sp.]
MKHIVVTDTQDDSFDFDAGWQGKAQFLFVKHGTVTTRDGAEVFMGNGGFESDGVKGESSPEVSPSNPTIANVTVITTDGLSARDGDASIAFKFDDSFNASLYNVLMTKATAIQSTCISFSSDGEKQADKIVFNNSVMACAAEFNDADGTFNSGSEPAPLTATLLSDWFDGTSSQRIAETSSVLAADGFATNTESADMTITPNDLSTLDAGFFDAAPYIGAVSDQDSSSSWYKWVETAVNAAELD